MVGMELSVSNAVLLICYVNLVWACYNCVLIVLLDLFFFTTEWSAVRRDRIGILLFMRYVLIVIVL